jgi:hypothetical protein
MGHMMSVDCGDQSASSASARLIKIRVRPSVTGQEMASKVGLVEVKIRREVAAREPALPF